MEKPKNNLSDSTSEKFKVEDKDASIVDEMLRVHNKVKRVAKYLLSLLGLLLFIIFLINVFVL